MEEYLKATYFYNYEHPLIQQFIDDHGFKEIKDPIEKVKAVYDAVRDGWRYNAYKMHFNPESCTASTIFQRPEGHCIDKANLLITVLRAVGIPARLHLAKVRNHIAVELIIRKFKTDVLTPHGYVELFLNDRWIAATPAFNKQLCKILNVDVLEFDGENDGIFQQYNRSGNRFMEYLDDYGTFEDFPLEFVKENISEHYHQLREIVANEGTVDLQRE